jgi:CO/xanthine dehydrogenase FAD-binding subunit
MIKKGLLTLVKPILEAVTKVAAFIFVWRWSKSEERLKNEKAKRRVTEKVAKRWANRATPFDTANRLRKLAKRKRKRD